MTYMGYYTQDELSSMGFAKLGKNCKINKLSVFNDVSKVSLGDHVRIEAFTLINEEVELGNYVYVEPYAFLSGFKGINVGDYSIIASRVSMFSSSSDYSGQTWPNPLLSPDELSKTNINPDLGPIKVGMYCTIGPNSVVLPNITIADGCSFGAFSLIKNSTDEWGIYAGIPAKRIKERSKTMLNRK